MNAKRYLVLIDGPELKRVREERGLKRWQVEEQTNRAISKHTIVNWENGKHRTTYNNIEILARLYEVPVEQLLAKPKPASIVEPVSIVEKWLQTVYEGDPDDGDKPVKQDEVLLTPLGGEEIEADITRIQPANMKGRKYLFRGIRVEGSSVDTIVGYYRRESAKGSIGTIILEQTESDSNVFQGYYLKFDRELQQRGRTLWGTVKIPLDWEFQGYQD